MNMMPSLVGCLSLLACGDAATSAPDLGPAAVLLDRCGQTTASRPAYFAKQGQRLQGLTGLSFGVQGARLGCQTVTGLTTQSGDLLGTAGGKTLASADFLGAALQIVDESGVKGELAVTKVETDPMDSSGATSLFTLVALDASSGTVSNVCVPDAEGRSAAIPLHGSWDRSGAYQSDGSLSFFCTSGVIAKCIRWGYRPWQSVHGTSLASHHQACTRMARADYCGNGTTNTQEGTQIDMYDSLGLHTPSQALSLLFEATWTPQGAYCIARERWLALATILPDSCKSQFELALQSSPIVAADLCLSHRIGSAASTALLSDRTGVNLGL
jgi:hypothetical protein